MPTLLTALVVAFCALVLVAPQARAADLSFGHNVEVCDPSAGCDDGAFTSYFEFEADAGESNRVTLRFESRRAVVVEDTAAPLRLTEGTDDCRTVDAHTVRCRPLGPVGGAVALGDGNDRLLVDGMYARVEGGNGDDEIRGIDASMRVRGEPGADRMVATDRGALEVDYSTRRQPLRLTVDGLADDGAAAEGDHIAGNVHSIQGGAGDDVIAAGRRRASLYGGAGDDRLRGGPRRDFLDGGKGADRLFGGAGPDTVGYEDARSSVRVTFGDAANDGVEGERDRVAGDVENVLGGSYDDHLIGSGDANGLYGQNGSDLIEGRGGDDRLAGGYDYSSKRDRVVGGDGRDRITQVDRFDRVAVRDDAPDTVMCLDSAPRLAADPIDRFRSCAPRLGMDRASFYTASGDGVFAVRCARDAQVACRGVAVVIAPSGRRWVRRFGPIGAGRRRMLRIDARLGSSGRKATVVLRTRRVRPTSATVTRNRVASCASPRDEERAAPRRSPRAVV